MTAIVRDRRRAGRNGPRIAATSVLGEAPSVFSDFSGMESNMPPNTRQPEFALGDPPNVDITAEDSADSLDLPDVAPPAIVRDRVARAQQPLPIEEYNPVRDEPEHPVAIRGAAQTQPQAESQAAPQQLDKDVGQRRRRYMEERHPGVASGAVNVDDPDTVINTARYYFEEGEARNAIELLTYSCEERPAQVRFWLALFEIYRLEHMAPEFCALATKFYELHGADETWPKVQHVGRDLDPASRLFAAAPGRLGLPSDNSFDPVAENWLNAPMDFTTDLLLSELRGDLMSEHGVDSSELQAPRLTP